MIQDEEVEATNLPPRRGACCAVDQVNGLAYVFRGYPDHLESSLEYQQCINVFNFNKQKWFYKQFNSLAPSFSVSACCTILNNDKLIIFSGWNRGNLSNIIHELNLSTMKWAELSNIDMVDRPIRKNKGGMVAYGDNMVFTFGGYGKVHYIGRHVNLLQKGSQFDVDHMGIFGEQIGWTNEQHLFHVIDKKWIIPETTGMRPPPCAGFSINKIDPFRVAIFGGRQKAERVNELYILDMSTWHWSSIMPPIPPDQTPWPSKRSFHTATPLYDPNYIPVNTDTQKDHFDWLPCKLPNLVTHKPMNIIKEQQLLVLWGMNVNGDPCQDVGWVLHLGTMTWNKVELPSGYVPRLWHTTESYYPTPLQCIVMSHGGITENLFAKDDAETSATNETVILNYGMVSLYNLCQITILKAVQDVTMLRNLPLPDRILSQLLL